MDCTDEILVLSLRVMANEYCKNRGLSAEDHICGQAARRIEELLQGVEK